MGPLQRQPGQRSGRSNARGERTRLAIVDALLALVVDGDLRPTVPRVAERAGLSLRSVFHHFNEVEVLLLAALDRQWERSSTLPRGVPAGLPEQARLERFVRQRARFFEETMPIRRAVALCESQSPRLHERLSAIHRQERDEALVALTGSTRGASLHVPGGTLIATESGLYRGATTEPHGGAMSGPMTASERAVLEAGLVTASSFATWESLRLRMNLSPEAARRTMTRLLMAQVAFVGDA